MSRNTSRVLRISPELIETVLNQLDARESRRGCNRRKSARYKYRSQSLVVEFTGNEGQIQYVVPTRDLSRDGVAFLIGHYVYPGARCRVRLVSEYNIRRDVEGVVRRCAYVAGTTGLHEVGVAFDHPIDVALFHRGASSAKVLIVDDDPASRELLAELFRRLNVEVTVECEAARALEDAAKHAFDMLLVNRDASAFKACEIVHELRKRGYVRPIYSLSARSGQLDQAACKPDGCQDCRLIPLTRESLQMLIGRVRSEPVVSSFGHDQSMTATINAFVAGLPRHTRTIEASFASGDLPGLTTLLQRLAALAAAAGFDLIHARCNTLLQKLAGNTTTEAIRDEVGELSILCQSARPATLPDSPAVAEAPAESGGLS